MEAWPCSVRIVSQSISPCRRATSRRRGACLLIVLAVSIVFPLACLAGYGYFDYQRRIADSNDMIDRLARVERGTGRQGDGPEPADGIARGRIARQSDDAQIRARQADLHDRLRAIGGDFPQVASIYRAWHVRRSAGVEPSFSGAGPLDRSARRFQSRRKRCVRSRISPLPLFGTLSQTDLFQHADRPLR